MCKNDVKNCENVVMDTSCNAQTKEIDPQRIFGVHLQREPLSSTAKLIIIRLKKYFRPITTLEPKKCATNYRTSVANLAANFYVWAMENVDQLTNQ